MVLVSRVRRCWPVKCSPFGPMGRQMRALMFLKIVEQPAGVSQGVWVSPSGGSKTLCAPCRILQAGIRGRQVVVSHMCALHARAALEKISRKK